MIESSWHIEEPAPDEATTVGQAPVLVTLHFLRTALRQRWRVWVGLGCVGMILGLASTFAFPAKSTGTVTLLLAHDPTTEQSQAMATDVSLLSTRTVAARVIDRLGLTISPDSFQSSVTATSVSPEILFIEVSAPDDRAAVTRARVLSEAFLRFRSEQIRAQSAALIDGYSKRVSGLQKQNDRLARQYDALASGGVDARSQAADLLAQRSQLNAEINTFQQTIQDTSLKTQSIVAASHIVDPASIVRHSWKKRAVLAMGSGMIAGTALGVGLVLFTALTSDRLRRRDEVASALGVPVRVSVSSEGPGRRLPTHAMGGGSSAGRDLQVLVHGLESAVSPQKKTSRKGRPPRVALATVDHAEVATLVVASLAARLAERGLTVFLVDLSESGRLESTVAAAAKEQSGGSTSRENLTVFRPSGIPSLARGPVGLTAGTTTDLPHGDPMRSAWDRADVVLALAEVDPAVGAEHIATWTDQVVLLVTAGRSSAERLRTSAELIQTVELGLPFAMMVGAHPTDESLGMPEALDREWPEGRRTS
jgi:uncharacterized protein involved in exopolysaccharide biosynthesis